MVMLAFIFNNRSGQISGYPRPDVRHLAAKSVRNLASGRISVQYMALQCVQIRPRLPPGRYEALHCCSYRAQSSVPSRIYSSTVFHQTPYSFFKRPPPSFTPNSIGGTPCFAPLTHFFKGFVPTITYFNRVNKK